MIPNELILTQMLLGGGKDWQWKVFLYCIQQPGRHCYWPCPHGCNWASKDLPIHIWWRPQGGRQVPGVLHHLLRWHAHWHPVEEGWQSLLSRCWCSGEITLKDWLAPMSFNIPGPKQHLLQQHPVLQPGCWSQRKLHLSRHQCCCCRQLHSSAHCQRWHLRQNI